MTELSDRVSEEEVRKMRSYVYGDSDTDFPDAIDGIVDNLELYVAGDKALPKTQNALKDAIVMFVPLMVHFYSKIPEPVRGGTFQEEYKDLRFVCEKLSPFYEATTQNPDSGMLGVQSFRQYGEILKERYAAYVAIVQENERKFEAKTLRIVVDNC
jgi:hypothetical protein